MANITRRPSEIQGYWDPFRIMFELFDREPGRELRGALGTFEPTFEVFERKDGYVFKGDLPGVKQDDLEITLTHNRLTIGGKREAEERKEGERFYAAERSYGTFSRSFTLPEGVDAEHVHADLRDGVLTLVIPKKPEVLPKKITIKAGAPKQ
jgi:HSP20 family protein